MITYIVMRSHCSAIIKQPCLSKKTNGKEREKCYYKLFSKYFGKINRNVENMTSEEIVFLQKQPPEVFCKKGIFRKFAKFTGKHLCQTHFLNKVAGQDCNFIKKEAQAQVFSCEFSEISKNTFFASPERLLLFLSKKMAWFYFSNLFSFLEILPKIRSVWKLHLFL